MMQTVLENLRFEALDATGAAVVTQDTSWTVRWFTRPEMACLLELCGFGWVGNSRISTAPRRPMAASRSGSPARSKVAYPIPFSRCHPREIEG